MLLKATFPSSYLGLVEAKSAVVQKWMFFRKACYKFKSDKNTLLPQQYIIYSKPFRRTVHASSPSKRCDHASQKHQVLGKPPLIPDTSTTICTRFNSRTAPLCPNLDCNLWPTLTAYSKPLPFSELAETRSRQVIYISIRVLG